MVNILGSYQHPSEPHPTARQPAVFLAHHQADTAMLAQTVLKRTRISGIFRHGYHLFGLGPLGKTRQKSSGHPCAVSTIRGFRRFLQWLYKVLRTASDGISQQLSLKPPELDYAEQFSHGMCGRAALIQGTPSSFNLIVDSRGNPTKADKGVSEI